MLNQKTQKMTAAEMIKMVKDIDPRFTVKELTYLDDRDRPVKAVKVSMPHAVYGELKHVTDVAEGSLIKFWPEQNKHVLDQTPDEQIQEAADQMRIPAEKLKKHLAERAARAA